MEIMRNPIWKAHIRDVRYFCKYLEQTDSLTFRITGTTDYEGHDLKVVREVPYVHRWTALYKSAVIAKFYQLEYYLADNPVDTITMLTLTTFHAYDKNGRPSANSTATIPEAFETLKTGWDKLRNAIKAKGYNYVWILEPHKTGYPHIHVIILGEVKPRHQTALKNLWFKYGCGSAEHGAKFTAKTGPDSVKSIRNYLMKYMIKSWKDSRWTTAQLVFNAVVKKNNWKLWGSTSDITEIMKRDAPPKTGIDWHKTETLRPGIIPDIHGNEIVCRLSNTVWEKPEQQTLTL